MGEGEGGEVAGGSIDLVNEWQARGNERNRRGGRKGVVDYAKGCIVPFLALPPY